jgi:1,4-dihydroxy-6-naphthoate synthase
VELSLGFSPCPNDTFILDALVHQKVDTGDFRFKYVLEDVETLNKWATQGKLDITKMSFAASCALQEQYHLLQSGAALGNGVGPLLISKKELDATNTLRTITDKPIQIAVPGEKTTAHFLLNYFAPELTHKFFMPFHAIEDWVLNEKDDAYRLGVIIHENRFTYQNKGLHKVQDLGAYWEQQTQLPIPLGGIFIKQNFSKEVQYAISTLIKQSLEYAFINYKTELPSFVTTHAQEMSEAVMWQHINLYVNDYSLALGKDGMEAVNLMRQMIG